MNIPQKMNYGTSLSNDIQGRSCILAISWH